MYGKEEILEMLRDEFTRWEKLLSSMSEEQISETHLPSNLSVKDVIAHLWAWQQRSIARMEAALRNREPEFPMWPGTLNPDSEDPPDQINAWIYETNREKSWSSVYKDWRDGFLRFLESGEEIPEKDLLNPGRYAWLEGYSLADVLLSSYEHHHVDHLVPLLAWLHQNGRMIGAG